MGTYIIRRLLWCIALLFIVMLITFIIFNVFPSADPAALRAGRSATPQLIAQIRHNLGLDRSKPYQFDHYVARVIPIALKGSFPFIRFDSFDLGYSYQNNASVRSQIFDRLPATISLTFGAVIVWLFIGLSVGIISAIRRRSILDRLSMGGALVAISAPVYWLGLVSLYLFAKDIGQFPVFKGSGTYVPIFSFSPAKVDAGNFTSWFGSLILPWLVLATAFSAFYARLLRGNLIEVMSEDYIRTARAKGLPERRVILRHGMRSAITPIVTVLGLDIGILLGGAILTESVFNIPGIGRLAFDAIQNSDLPMIQGTVLFGAFFIVLANLIVDIAYAFLDPRVRYS